MRHLRKASAQLPDRLQHSCTSGAARLDKFVTYTEFVSEAPGFCWIHQTVLFAGAARAQRRCLGELVTACYTARPRVSLRGLQSPPV